MRTSFLIPTRGRPDLLENSIYSILSNAKNPNNVEIILGIDSDDVETLKWVGATNFRHLIFDRMGYKNLYKYYNRLADATKSNFVVIWNDDAVITSKNFDEEFERYENWMVILRMQVTNHPHPFALFPVVPRKWIELLGYLSPTAQIDRFIYEVCGNMNPMPMVNIPVECMHLRYDLTGENKDATYDEREYMEGNPNNPEHIDSPKNQNIIRVDAMKVLNFLKHNGVKYEK